MFKYLNVKMTQKGASLFLALIIMILLLAIGLGISAILVGQLKMVKGMGNSVVAIYAADTGIERILYEIRKEDYDPSTCKPTPCQTPFSGTVLGGEATYTTYIQNIGPPIKIQSVGKYKEIKRAIEISY